jgi:hypothetical protein
MLQERQRRRVWMICMVTTVAASGMHDARNCMCRGRQHTAPGADTHVVIILLVSVRLQLVLQLCHAPGEVVAQVTLLKDAPVRALQQVLLENRNRNLG